MAELTAKDMVEMLRRHYLPEGRPAGGVLAVEIGAPDGGRRADALWAPLTYTGGDGIVGHEVKVSRADVMAELSDPTKSQAWAQYCTQWYLTISDPALIEGLDIPEQWGIMSPPSGRRTRTMTVVREAPKLKPGDTSAAWRRVMAWNYFRQQSEISTRDRYLEQAERTAQNLRDEIKRREDRAWAAEDRDAAQVRQIVTAARELIQARADGHVPWNLDRDFDHPLPSITVDDIALALADMAALNAINDRLTKDIEFITSEASRLNEPITKALDAIAALAARREVAAHD